MLYFLDHTQEVKRIETKPFEVVQTFELDGQNLLKDSIYIEAPLTEERYDYIAVKSKDSSKHQFDMYKIVNQTTEGNKISYDGIQLGYSDLAGYFLEYLHPDHQRLNLILDELLKGTGWRIGYLHRNPLISLEMENMSYKDALKTLVSSAGLEMRMHVEISGSRVTDRWIDVYEEIGLNTGYRFTYGDNALQIVQETSQGNLFTALIGEGKTIRDREMDVGDQLKSWRLENNMTQEEMARKIGVQYSTIGLWESNRQMPRADNAQKLQDLTGIQILGDGYGKKVNFEEVETDYKPKGQNYVELPEMTARYGIKTDSGMNKRLGKVEFNEEEDPEKLLELTYDYLKLVSRPRVLFRANVVDVGSCDIGDRVTIHRYDLDIHYETRIRKVVRDRLSENKTEVEIGDWMPTATEQISQSISQTLDAVGKAEESFYRAISVTHKTADGKNNISYGDQEPERKRVGDLWFKPHPKDPSLKQMLVWTGKAWEDPTGGESATSKIAEAESLIAEVKKLAEKNASEISNAIEGTGFVSLSDLIASKVADDDFASLFFQKAESIGLAYEENGEPKAMIGIIDGIPYVQGKKVMFNADEVLMDGTLTVTEEMFSDGITFNWAKGKTFDASQIRVINLDADSITGGSLDLAKGLTIRNGNQVILSVDSQGRTVFNAPDYLATKDDLKKIELSPGAKGEPGRDGKDGKSGRLGRNLLIGSNEPVSTTNYRIQRIPLAETPKDDEELTLTVKIREPLKDYGRWLKAYHGGSSIELAELKQTDKDRNIYSATFPWKNEKEVNDVSFTADEPFLWLYSGPNQSSNPEVHFEWAVLARGDVEAFDWYASDEEIMQLTRDNQNQIQEMGDEVGEIYKAFQDYKKILDDEDTTRNEIERAVENMRQRIELIDVNLGEFSRRTDFVNNYILEADEGLFVGERGTKTGILIGTDRISFQDNGREVASISQQLLTINRALLVESLEVHPYKFEPINDGQYGVWSWLGQEVENGNN